MKLVNTQLQSQMERLSKAKSTEYFIEHIRAILEDTSRPYYKRADYLGLSLLELQSKIDTLTQDIQELQKLKKRLSEASEIAKEVIASIFVIHGIDRMDGNILSSLTLTPETSKTKLSLKILDEEAVMRLGYIKVEPDLQAIEKAMMDIDSMEELDEFVSIESTSVTIPAKIKVNTKKRTSHHTQVDELLALADNAA